MQASQRKFSLDLKRAQSCAYIYAGIILSFLSDYAEIQLPTNYMRKFSTVCHSLTYNILRTAGGLRLLPSPAWQPNACISTHGFYRLRASLGFSDLLPAIATTYYSLENGAGRCFEHCQQRSWKTKSVCDFMYAPLSTRAMYCCQMTADA